MRMEKSSSLHAVEHGPTYDLQTCTVCDKQFGIPCVMVVCFQERHKGFGALHRIPSMSGGVLLSGGCNPRI